MGEYIRICPPTKQTCRSNCSGYGDTRITSAQTYIYIRKCGLNKRITSSPPSQFICPETGVPCNLSCNLDLNPGILQGFLGNLLGSTQIPYCKLREE